MIDNGEQAAALQEEWPLRPWLLAAIGALAGLAIWHLLDVMGTITVPWRTGLAAFVFFAALATGFVLRPVRQAEAAVFALGLGAVMGSIAWLAARAGDRYAGEEFAFAAGVFFSALAVPLFQADFHRRRWATPYAEAHFHVWTDAISAGGAAAFMLLSFALLWLLHGLFSLVGITIIEDLIRDGWFVAMFFGGTFGAALGVLRNQVGVIGTLQRVVMLVFALLAVPFAAAILVFLVILLFSGGDALWNATDSATPVLLACAVGCFVLANAVVRDDDAARSRNPAMQAAALALALAILPLTVFAGVSMGIRVGQHGLSPERLWALVAIAISTAYGIAYWAALARGRMAGWAHHLRRANLHLAVATCAVALVLAFPLLDFGAVSARNQVARLERGAVSAQEFDFTALRWDFGDAGRRALDRLAAGGGDVATLAIAARAQVEPPWDYADSFAPRAPEEIALRVQPENAEVRELVMGRLQAEPYRCTSPCVALDLGTDAQGVREIALVETAGYDVLRFGGSEAASADNALAETPPPLTGTSRVELREEAARYIYVDGRRVGIAIDDAPRIAVPPPVAAPAAPAPATPAPE